MRSDGSAELCTHTPSTQQAAAMLSPQAVAPHNKAPDALCRHRCATRLQMHSAPAPATALGAAAAAAAPQHGRRRCAVGKVACPQWQKQLASTFQVVVANAALCTQPAGMFLSAAVCPAGYEPSVCRQGVLAGMMEQPEDHTPTCLQLDGQHQARCNGNQSSAW